MVDGLGRRGVDGGFKNLIFAADGPKPELFFTDAVNNDVEITRNAEHCLIYNRPLTTEGLAWSDLVGWWRSTHSHLAGVSDTVVGHNLYRRLYASLASEPSRSSSVLTASFTAIPAGSPCRR